ncbi:MAG: hypothetical protein GC186_06845 [Rhodobacteraceae bacterium]|nr:hypothetical protein [Paracoccaceae bacterium]
MRMVFPVLAALTLAACSQQVPDSAAGGTYGDYLKRADSGATSPIQMGDAVTSPDTSMASTSAGGGLDPNRPRGGDAPAGIASSHSNLEYDANGNLVPQVPTENRAQISDEQDFNAVKSRVSIQQDADRLAQQRAQYQIINPQPLPPRPMSDGPNLAQYALSTTNNVGQKRYDRVNIFGHDSYLHACARYTSPDLAQMAFLKAGGPSRDPQGIDPDGDGFACDWDPAPFRKVSP